MAETQDFEAAEAELRVDLLALQRELAAHGLAVIVVLAGPAGCGRGEITHRLNEWLDPRGVETHAFWRVTDDERERPWFWRFWQRLPAVGRISLLFSGWYGEPVDDRVQRRSNRSALERRLSEINAFEQLLVDDRTILIKVWLDISAARQQQRLQRRIKDHRLTVDAAETARRDYERLQTVAETVLAETTAPGRRWHRIKAGRRNARDVEAGRCVRDEIRAAIADRCQADPSADTPPGEYRDHLGAVDLSQRTGRSRYGRDLRALQKRLARLTWQAHQQQLSTIAVFEGWDAAGKGGAIRRLTQALDPRLYCVVPVAAPTDEELRQHYLWRFWRHLPRDGHIVLFDRSWYGRVLVERVEGFALRREWQRGFWEIRQFEHELADHGALVEKFWLHISDEEQLNRFNERAATPWKAHKLTDEDWRNRDRRRDYEDAINQMVEETSTERAPWHLVAAENKRHARLEVLKCLSQALEHRLDTR